MSKNIVEYYNNIYANNPKRTKLNQDELKLKICNILQILINYIPQNNKSIWPPRISAINYNGFSQKIIEQIIKSKCLKDDLIKYQYLLGIICKDDYSSDLFLHTVSKDILFKKREQIRGGTDIRVINILPSWLIILEKLCMNKINELLRPKITMMQFGFTEG